MRILPFDFSIILSNNSHNIMWLLSEMCKDLNVWTRKFMGHCDIKLIGLDECRGFYCSHTNCAGQNIIPYFISGCWNRRVDPQCGELAFQRQRYARCHSCLNITWSFHKTSLFIAVSLYLCQTNFLQSSNILHPNSFLCKIFQYRSSSLWPFL